MDGASTGYNRGGKKHKIKQAKTRPNKKNKANDSMADKAPAVVHSSALGPQDIGSRISGVRPVLCGSLMTTADTEQATSRIPASTGCGQAASIHGPFDKANLSIHLLINLAPRYSPILAKD